MSGCPCNLSREEVLKLADEDLFDGERVAIVKGFCQNPKADGSEGVCGKPLGAHSSERGEYIVLSITDRIYHQFIYVSCVFVKEDSYTITLKTISLGMLVKSMYSYVSPSSFNRSSSHSGADMSSNKKLV